MWRIKLLNKEETPVEYCRRKQEECLDRVDERGALVYYEMAKMWMKREKKDESVSSD